MKKEAIDMKDMEAPDFCLPNQWDEKVCLSDLRGKWVVLYFYQLFSKKTPSSI